MTTIYAESWEASNRLAGLGLEESLLIQSVQAGFSAWASCTENHPPSSPGYYAWAETVRTLREQLAPLGWSRLNEANLPLVVNQDGTIAISVSTGNENTGRTDGNPCTNSAKGPRTAGVIQVNQLQELLFPEMALPSREVLDTAGRTTWILLMHRDIHSEEIRCELSRPIGMTEDGHVDGWAERIILKPTQFDRYEVTKSVGGGGEGPTTPEIIVQINKHA